KGHLLVPQPVRREVVLAHQEQHHARRAQPLVTLALPLRARAYAPGVPGADEPIAPEHGEVLFERVPQIRVRGCIGEEHVDRPAHERPTLPVRGERRNPRASRGRGWVPPCYPPPMVAILEAPSSRAMTLAEWAAMPEDEPGELVDGLLVEEEVADTPHE